MGLRRLFSWGALAAALTVGSASVAATVTRSQPPSPSETAVATVSAAPEPASTAAPSPPPQPVAAVACADPEITGHTIESFDGTPIAVTVFRPCSAEPVPMVLTLHGWTGSRIRDVAAARDLLDAGYGVIGIDARGNGTSGGTSLILHPELEMRDFSTVIDWVHDHLGWIEREDSGITKDVRIGARGASYGGAFQLMLAAFDERLDVMLPDHTWNDLERSLQPYGATRTWADLLFDAGRRRKRLDPRTDAWYADLRTTGRFGAEARDLLAASSPRTYADRLDVPAFFTQGTTDTLFPLDEGIANLDAVRRAGADAWMLGLHRGHGLGTIVPGAPVVERSESGCLERLGRPLSEVQVAVLDAFLKRDAVARAWLDTLPRIMVSTEQGGCITGDSWPLASREMRIRRPTVRVPAGSGVVDVPLVTAVEELTVVGAPVLGAQMPRGTAHFSLVVTDGERHHLVDDQVTGVRSDGGRVSVSMATVATTLLPGQRLVLRVEPASPQYIEGPDSFESPALITDLEVTVPVR